MAFRGFLIESRSFMNYPHCGKFYFWRRFPTAFLKFHYTNFKYWGFSYFKHWGKLEK